MKKFGFILSVCLFMAAMAGCGGKETAAKASAIEQADTVTADAAQNDAPADGVDVDLTALSSTMVYAEVYNMVTNPEMYMGETVKVCGQYYASYYETTGQYYHYVIVADATACCQQGLEFVWNGDHTYPDDYPEDGAQVEMTGVFGSYDELGITYYYLAVDRIDIL